MSYFARMRGVPERQWFAEAWGKGSGESEPIGFILHARYQGLIDIMRYPGGTHAKFAASSVLPAPL